MPVRRLIAVALSLLLAAALAPPAVAAPPVEAPRGAPQAEGPFGRGPEDRSTAAPRGGPDAEPAPATRLPGKPRNDVIADVPVNPGDASIPLNLIPYHEIPARLRALQASDRISVEVIGQSVQGRDLHLVVATAPMTDAQWAEWQRLSDLRTADPHAALAALEAGEYDAWRSPLMVTNNIHGNEWEGTDAALQVLDVLATSDAPEVERLLSQHLLVFVVTQNPDGRVAGTRANANGFDMNRDFITQSQPEARATRDQMIRYNPLTQLDQHGYTGTTLIEPTTGPHGDNYEYDLYIRNALRHALAMEQAVLGLAEPLVSAVNIPYRNRTTGWDDWPPIFTPMYAMYHGVVGHTIEFPLNPRSSRLSTEERHERTRINTAVSRATMESSFAWANANRMTLLADQLELYRRGLEGEGTRPIDDELALALAAGDNAKTVTIEFPRAYVIPAGADQRSHTAAARLVQFLVDNDVQVHRTARPTTIGGTRYAAGSYVVDMHQPKRGLANTILDVGRDVSDAYPTMYDISAWSQAHLWGATVAVVRDGELDSAARRGAGAAAPTGTVAPGRRAAYGLQVDSLAGIQAVNFLQAAGAALSRRTDGTFVVPESALPLARQAAARYGVAFTALPPAGERTAQPVQALRVGVSAPSDEVWALTRMGFALTPVSHGALNGGTVSFDDLDALYVSTGAFNPLALDPAPAAAFAAWLAAGGVVVGRGGNGALFNARAGLLPVTAVAYRGDANGIVAVTNDPASPIAGDALPASFVTSPRTFTVDGEGVRVDQRLGGEGFFLAGHWIGSQAAAGQPVVVSGTARGASVALFGTEPLYRGHPEGLHLQVAEALWATGR